MHMSLCAVPVFSFKVVTHNREIVNSFRKRVITMRKGVIVSDEEEGGYRED